MLAIRAIVVVLLAFSSVSAEIYSYVDESGAVFYTDAPMGKGASLVMSTGGRRSGENPANIQSLINEAGSRYSLDPSLIHAVITTESNFNAYAVSRKGAMGLMQLMPATAASLGVKNPFHAEQNIDGGVRYLKYLIERFGGNLRLALAAYNCGPEHVEKYGSVPPIRETKDYVKKVLAIYDRSSGIQAEPDASAGPSKPARKAKKAPPTTIYKLVLEDGTVLFTNTLPRETGSSRF